MVSISAFSSRSEIKIRLIKADSAVSGLLLTGVFSTFHNVQLATLLQLATLSHLQRSGNI